MVATSNPKLAEAKKLHAAGKSKAEVARLLGLPVSTVKGWLLSKPPEQPSDTETSRVAALEMELASLRSAASRPNITSQYQGVEDLQKTWLAAEVENAERIQKALERSVFNLDLTKETKPIALTFISDQHISMGNTVDLRRMREDAEVIAAADGCYAFLGGDGVDNHLKHRGAVLAARSTPGDQWKMYDWYLSIFAHRIACVVSGNHDAWSEQFAGIDMVKILAESNRLAYAPHEAHIYCKFAGHEISIGMRHQYKMNSSLNQGHAAKQWHRFGSRMHDIYCIGHHHEAHTECGVHHGKFRHFCRPGSYQIMSSYSETFGWNHSVPTCPTYIVWPNERRIQGYQDVRAGLEVLALYRK